MAVMGSRKPYRRPELESYGDIRRVTASTLKEFGSTDGFILVQDGTQSNLKNFS